MSKRQIAVIGLGSFGLAIARELSELGERVTGIDNDSNLIASTEEYLSVAICGDASNPAVLSDCSIRNFDLVVVSIGENTEASLLAAMNVLDSGAPEVWVKAQNATHARILEAIGVHRIVQPESAYGKKLAHEIRNQGLTGSMPLHHGMATGLFAIDKDLTGDQLLRRFAKRDVEYKPLLIFRDSGAVDAFAPDCEIGSNDLVLIHGTMDSLKTANDS
ncbi:MAG: TrkA family potassium uptake protein [Pseudomonadota bacterium]